MVKVTWAKAPDGSYYTLTGWDFSSITIVGVYHIWLVGNGFKRNIRSGQGIIGARLGVHKTDSKITRHGADGPLHVTWAAVPAAHLDAVERYLADQFQPVEGDRYPDVAPMAVNLPGA
jgi:hypothetical protein